MSPRIFITGATGFVGHAVTLELVSRGYGVNALVRGKKDLLIEGDIKTFRGELLDANVVDEAMAGCTGVVHLVGIIAEDKSKRVTFERIHVKGTAAIVDATKRANIRRYLHMSANGTRPDAVSQYHQTKWAAEQYVRDSGLDWTIFRPSLIHGPGGEFSQMEAAWARGRHAPFIFMPYFGAGLLGTGGAGKLQPVYVDDVATAFVDAIKNDKTIGKTYELGGDERITWPQMHHLAAQAITGKTRPAVAIPAWWAKALTKVAPAKLLPFNRDQVEMSQEDNSTDLSDFVRDFGWKPRGFSATLNEYASEL